MLLPTRSLFLPEVKQETLVSVKSVVSIRSAGSEVDAGGPLKSRLGCTLETHSKGSPFGGAQFARA